MGDGPDDEYSLPSQESDFDKWVDNECKSIADWWHNFHIFGSGPKPEAKVVTPGSGGADTHIAAGTPGADRRLATPAPPAPSAPTPEVMPKPDQSGTLTVDFNSKFFNDAIHQGGVKKLVINHQGKADVHVEVEPDGKGGQAFWGVVDEPGVKGQDKKKFILPSDVDYITINQQKIDDKTNKPVVDDQQKPVYDPPTNRVAGQLRLQAFRAYFEAPSGGNYGGSSSVPTLRGVVAANAPDNAGQTQLDDFIKNSGNISSDFLSQVDAQFQHDKTVKEDADEPWFSIMLGQVHTLQAGQELKAAHDAKAIDKASLEAKVDQSLVQADQDFQAAMTTADKHLADGDKQPHLSSGQVPRYYSDMPKGANGQIDWSNPDADRFYYGSAKDLAAFQDRRLVKDRASLTSGMQFYVLDKETLDQLLPPVAKPKQ
jgi:hypothetical protein